MIGKDLVVLKRPILGIHLGLVHVDEYLTKEANFFNVSMILAQGINKWINVMLHHSNHG